MSWPSKTRRTLIASGTMAVSAVAAACVVLAMYVSLDEGREVVTMQGLPPVGSTPSPSVEIGWLTNPTQQSIGTAQFEESLGADEVRPVTPYDAGVPMGNQPTVDLMGSTSSLGVRSLGIVAGQGSSTRMKFVIGPTAVLLEPQSELEFRARIDTGARSCSLHVQKIVIQDEADVMEDNVGKEIRFKVANHEGASHWLKSIIDCCVNVRNSNTVEQRYKVPIAFRWNDFERTVLVTLNDRARMTFPLLLGRNFLEENFVVDVSLDDDL